MRKSWLKYLFLFLFTTIGFLDGNAQKTKIFFSSGYGSYRMSDLKELHQHINSQIPVRIKVIDDFPSNWNFEGGMNFPLFQGEHSTGFFLNYHSTGSRSGIMDYSGYYKADMLLNSVGLGTFYGIKLRGFSWLEAHVKAKINYQMTRFEIIESAKINDFKSNEKFEFRGEGLELGAEFQVEKDFGWFSLFTSAGYSINMSGPIHLKEDKDYNLLHNDDTVRADWSGWRLKLGTSIYL